MATLGLPGDRYYELEDSEEDDTWMHDERGFAIWGQSLGPYRETLVAMLTKLARAIV